MGNFRDRRVYEIGLITISDVSPLFRAALEQYCESLEMDSEAKIIEGVLGRGLRSLLTMADERAIIKLCLKTSAGSSHGTSVQALIRFLILHSVYDSLGRFATASERTG